MKLKDELLNNSIYITHSENKLYDYIYFIQQRKKHSSGYNFIHIYGEILEEKKYYMLSRCSDVIDFNEILCKFEWFCSIDIPEYNVIRLFTRKGYKFKCDYLNISSFKIDIVKG